VAAAVNGAAPAAYAADQAPPGMNAAAISGYRTISDVGYVIGPVMLGLLVDWQGAEAGLLFAALLVFAVGAMFWRYAPENWQGVARR
jgi:MFS family permease